MNKNKDEDVYRINKPKAVTLTLIIIGLLILVIWFFMKVVALPSAFNRTFLLICCSLLIIVFTGCGITAIKNLIDSRRGIVINSEGIKIDTGPNKGHFISWGEITGLEVYVRGNIFLLIFIENPNRLFDETHGLQKILLKMNNISHKTPVSLTATWLDCNFETLAESVRHGLKIYKKRCGTI